MSKYFGFLNAYRQNKISYVILIGIPILYLSTSIYFIISDANWTFGDDAIFLKTLANGQHIQSFYSPDSGRFFPLAFLEYNLLGFDASPTRYYVWQAVKFIMLILLFYNLMNTIINRITPSYTHFLKNITISLLLCFFISADSMFLIYANLIYAESSALVLLACFLIFYIRLIYVSEQKKLSIALAFLFASISFYFKEPIFGSVSVMLLFSLLFKAIRKKSNLVFLSLILIFSIGIYIGLYHLLVWSKHTGSYYNVGRVPNYSLLLFLKTLAKAHPLLVVTFFVGGIRILDIGYRSVFTKQRISRDLIVFDGLLHAGNSYIFAYYLLRLIEGYYFTISYIFILPALAFYMFYYLHNFDFISIEFIYKRKKIFRLSYITFLLPATLLMSTTYNTAVSYKNEIKTSKSLRTKQFAGLESMLPSLKENALFLVPKEDALKNPFQKRIIGYYYVTLKKDINFLSSNSSDIQLYYPHLSSNQLNYVQKYCIERGNTTIKSYSSIPQNKSHQNTIIVLREYASFLPFFLQSYKHISGVDMYLPFDFYVPYDDQG